MAYVPNSNSVVAFQSDGTKLGVSGSVTTLQGTNPWKVELTSGSVITAGGNSSVQVVGTMPPQSVSGVGTFNINPVGGGSVIAVLKDSSVAALQGTNPWKVELTSGSVITTGGNSSVQVNNILTGNSSVQVISGTGVIGSVTALQGTNPWVVGNSSVSLMPSGNAIGSVTALQGTNPWLVQTTGSVLNQYREDNLGSSVVGVAMMFKRTDSASLMSAVSPNYPLPVQGSVTTLQGTQPWLVQVVSSVTAVAPPSSVQLMAGTNIVGSVAVLQGTNPWVVGNSSVQVNNMLTGQSSVYLIPGVGVLGSVAALQGTQPWLVQVVSSVTAVAPPSSVQLMAGTNAIGSVAVLQGTSPWLTVPTSGSIFAYQAAGSVMAVNTTVTTGPSSVQLLSTSASIAVLVNNILQGNSSVQLITGIGVIGSVATLQGTDPWRVITPGSVVTVWKDSSVLAGLTSTNASLVGTYAEDAAHSTNDRGYFILGVRNDNMASVTSANTDYSPIGVGPIGENIVANAPITKWITAVGSVMSGPSVLFFSAPGASIFQYVTGVQVTNPGTTAAHVTFTEGRGGTPASMMFWAMAPAGGGSNMVFPNPIKTTLADKNISASVSAHASVYIMMEGFTAAQLT